MKILASLCKDMYKEFHQKAYHPDVSEVYINFTNRSGRYSNTGLDGVVFVGLQYFIKSYLQDAWGEFFNTKKEQVIAEHKRVVSAILGFDVDVEYLAKLHDLGYLPLEIKALEEGTLVPYQVPNLTIRNTIDGFGWLPNMIETQLSACIWGVSTSATTSMAYLKKFLEYSNKTCANDLSVPFQGHDFSYRGMFGMEASALSGFGHLCSGLVGTDSIPAVIFAEQYYNADLENSLVGASVNATEHSVTCSWQDEGEYEFFKTLIEQTPKGQILSLVSDTWDYWGLLLNTLPKLKNLIEYQDIKVVIRPDSGDPVDIICGYRKDKGSVEVLWDIFGGTINDKGYKVLSDSIGLIYGDSITLDRQDEILSKLEKKGFASSNVVLGIGSYTYQYVTRDTHGSAVKATSIIKKGIRKSIFKHPKTDSNKKSSKGLFFVNKNFELEQDVSFEKEQLSGNMLKIVYKNGKLIKETSLNNIRKVIHTFIKIG